MPHRDRERRKRLLRPEMHGARNDNPRGRRHREEQTTAWAKSKDYGLNAEYALSDQKASRLATDRQPPRALLRGVVVVLSCHTGCDAADQIDY